MEPEGDATEVVVSTGAAAPLPAESDAGSAVAFAAGAASAEAEHAEEAAEDAEQTAEAAEQVAEVALDIASSAAGEAIEASLDAAESLDATAELAARVTALEDQLAAGPPATEAAAEPTPIEVEPNAYTPGEQGSEASGGGGEGVGETPAEPKRRRGFRGRRG